MISRYSVIHYVPNPIADERINIGVIVFNEEIVKVHFLHSWERINAFATEDTRFLQDFAKRMYLASKNGLVFPSDNPQSGQTKQERLTNVARDWINSIQFTEPRASLEDIDSVLEDCINTYLVDKMPMYPNVRDRQAAKRIVATSVRAVLKERLGNRATEFFKKDAEAIVKGFRSSHNFDVLVANGHPYLAAHGVSFEVRTHKETLDALSWWIEDVKKRDHDFPLAVVTLPPKTESDIYSQLFETYEHTRDTYTNLGASVLLEEEVPAWTNQVLTKANLI